MAKRKSLDAAESAPVIAEPTTTTRKTASRPKRTATSAAHKHHAGSTSEVVTESPVANSATPVTHESISKLAYSLWEARGGHGGSAEQDWLQAESQLLKFS